MFTASVIDSQMNDKEGTLNILVRYTDSSTGKELDEWYKTTDFVNDPDWYKRPVAKRLDSLNATQPVKKGSIDINTLIPSVDSEREAWLRLYAKLRTYQEANKSGVTSDTDPAYISLLSQVKSGYKPKYLDLQ